MKLQFNIKQKTEIVFEYLSDVQKFVVAHPVITKIENKGNGTYIAYETLKLGFIPVSFKYPFTIDMNAGAKTITMYATVMRFTKIEIHFKITEHKEFTLVEETITFKSPLPIKAILKRIFTQQHTVLFKNIEAV